MKNSYTFWSRNPTWGFDLMPHSTTVMGSIPSRPFCVSYMLVLNRWYDNKHRNINDTHKWAPIHGERLEYR